MKYLTIIFSLLCLSANALPGPEMFYNIYSKAKRSEYSLMLTYIMPQGKFAAGYQPGTYPQLGEALTQSMQGGVGGLGARNGYGFDFSGYYYMNDQPVPTVGGIKVTFLQIGNVPFRWHTDGDYIYNDAKYSDLRFFSFNLGPVIKMEIGDYSAIRIYTQICGAVGFNGGWSNGFDYTYVDVGSNEYFVHQDANLKFKGGTGFKSESGISLNGSSFMVGLAFSFGKITYNSMEYNTYSVTDSYKYDQPSGNYLYVKTTKEKQELKIAPAVPTSYLFLSAGFVF